MKKALTIYIDDDTRLTNICATFVCWEGEQSSVTMLNEKVPEEATGIFLPFKSQTGKTEWITDDSLPEIIEKDFTAWEQETTVTLGKNLREAIRRNGMTQKDLAKKINVTEVTISRYITGNRTPSAPTLYKMARVLGMTVEELLGES